MRAMFLLFVAGCSAETGFDLADAGEPIAPVLFFFVGPECPVSNFYAPEIERLSKRGVHTVLVYPGPGVTEETAARHAGEYRLTAPRMLDPEPSLARRFGVAKIPTAVLVDLRGVAYRGRIDDRYSPDGKRRQEPRSRDLEAAIEAVLAGRKPEMKETPVFGCPLVLKEVSR